jgi:hypothetical protein
MLFEGAWPKAGFFFAISPNKITSSYNGKASGKYLVK